MTDDWRTRAACRGLTHLMAMPDSARKSMNAVVRRHVARARTICNTCPARDACLDWALNDPDDDRSVMIAGGLTPRERRQERSAMRYPVPQPKPVAARWPGYVEVRGTPKDRPIAL